MAVCIAVLLGWNAWLTYEMNENRQTLPEEEAQESQTNGSTTVVSNTVTGYTTDLTSMVSSVQEQLVSVKVMDEDGSIVYEQTGSIYNAERDGCWILTSAEHLPDHTLQAVFYNGISVDCEPAGLDMQNDIALLLCHPEFEVAELSLGDSSLVKQGEYVVIPGATQVRTQNGSVSFGVASMPAQLLSTGGEERSWMSSVLTTDAVLARDCNGAPLVNLSGELIGMMSSRLSTLSSTYGMNAAVSVNEIRHAAEQIMQNGSVERGYLGVVGKDVSSLETYQKSALNMTLDTLDGVLVVDCAADSPAASAGIQAGDVISSIGETKIASLSDLVDFLYTCTPGQEAEINIIRSGESIAVKAVLG